jgi:iron complex outermembrane receptor protein
MKIIICILALGLISFGQSLQAQDQDSILKNFELKEVTVNAQKTSKTPNPHFYQSSSLASTEDILSRIEGVSLVRRGPIGMEPTLRGFAAGQVNLVIDGMKMFGACTDKMDPISIYVEPINLRSLDIGNGGEGMAMGSAIGGSMNLKLASAITNANQPMSLQFSSGFHSAAKASQNALALHYSKERWAVRVSGTYRKARDYTNGANQRVPFSQYEKFNVSASTSYTLSTRSSLDIDILIDDAWNIGYPALPMDVGKAEARIGALSYKNYDVNSWIDHLEGKVYANSIQHVMDDTKRPNVAMHMDMPGWSHTQGAYFQVKSSHFRKHVFNAKLDGYHNSIKADMTMYPPEGQAMYMLTWPKTDLYSSGLFLEDRIALNSKSELDIKTRLELTHVAVNDPLGQDQFSVFGYDISQAKVSVLKNIHAGYTYKLSPAITLFASLGYSERIPTASERFGFYLFNRMDNHDYIGNPLLKNEQAINSEINLLYTKPSFSWKVSGFHNYIHNYIQGSIRPDLSVMTIGAEGVRSYNNLPYATMIGMESHVNYRFFHQRFTVNQTLKWLKGTNMNGQPLPLMAPLKAITSIRFNHKHYFVQLENELSAAQNQIDSSFGEQKTPGFTIFNIRSNYHFKVQQHDMNFGLGVENMFNKAYFEHLDWGRFLRPGRNVYASLTFEM